MSIIETSEKEYIIEFNNWLINEYETNLKRYSAFKNKYEIWDNTIKILIKKILIDDGTIKKLYSLMAKYNKSAIPNYKKNDLFNCKNDYDIFYNELTTNIYQQI